MKNASINYASSLLNSLPHVRLHTPFSRHPPPRSDGKQEVEHASGSVSQAQEPEERPDAADESVEKATNVAFEDPVSVWLWDRGGRGKAECWWAGGR